MRTVEEINAQIAIHSENISLYKEQIDALSPVEGDESNDMTEIEQEIASEWDRIRELESERDSLPGGGF